MYFLRNTSCLSVRSPAAMLVIAGCVLSSYGCKWETSSPDPHNTLAALPMVSKLGVADGHYILAQGKLEPATGVVSVSAAPGDQINKIFVSAKDSVEVGTVLVELASLQIREAEIRAARAKRLEAEQQIAIARSTAEVRLQAAEIRLKSAQLSRQQAEIAGDGLGQLQRELAEARRVMDDLRQAIQDPQVAKLIGKGALNRQELSVQSAEQQSRLKTAEASAAIETAELAVAAAEQEVDAAKAALAAADGSAQLSAIDEQLKVLELQLRSSQLRSPIAGTVISVDATAGQSAGMAPLLQLANTEQMVCLAEVNVADLQRVQENAVATISSPALAETLQGRVKSISQMVGVPRLPNPNPMARTDWRAALVEIAIDPQYSKDAAARLNLQVEVAITAPPAKEAGAADPHPPTAE